MAAHTTTTYEVHPMEGIWEVRISGGDGQIDLASTSRRSREAAIWIARHHLASAGVGGRVLILDEDGNIARELFVEVEASSTSSSDRRSR